MGRIHWNIGEYRGIQGIQGIQGNTGRKQRRFKGIQGDTVECRGIQGIQGDSEEYRGIQWDTVGYRGDTEEIQRRYIRFTRDYRVVRGEYR